MGHGLASWGLLLVALHSATSGPAAASTKRDALRGVLKRGSWQPPKVAYILDWKDTNTMY